MNKPIRSAGDCVAWLRRRRVAVLKGGWSRERPISLKTGAAVEAAFARLGVPVLGLDVTRQVLSDLKKKKIDFCFIALHGAFGEDGRIQSALELAQVAYTGEGPLASGLAMDKVLAKRLFEESGVPTPAWSTVSADQFSADQQAAVAGIKKVFSRGPVFVKPYDQGSAIGASRVDTPRALPAALRACLNVSDQALVERFVRGRELTVGILGDDVLPVVEIIPEHRFYDFHSKYAKGGSRHLVPASLSYSLTERAQGLALKAFQALSCRVYGRVDLMLDEKNALSVLEVNTIPGMTATSLLPDAARSAGIDFDELVLRIVSLSVAARS